MLAKRFFYVCAGLLCLVSGAGHAQELVVNGDFSAGNTGFTTDYRVDACFYEGVYQILQDASTCYSEFVGRDHTSPGTGLFMVVNGHVVSGRAVWRQTISVTPHSFYGFSAWVSSLYPRNLALLDFRINGLSLGTLEAPPFPQWPGAGDWIRFSANWESNTASTATISIVDLNITRQGGNDFGLDDISFFVEAVPIGLSSFTIE